jgi:hypothetical protein
MLDHPRAHDDGRRFHYQLLQVDHYSDIYKDPVKYPNFDPSLNDADGHRDDDVRRRRRVQRRRPRDPADRPLHLRQQRPRPAVRRAGPLRRRFVKVDLDPATRAGVLTQIGFLASNAGAFENDPIHRGVFMNLQLLCTGLPPPPNMVPPLPPPSRARPCASASTGTPARAPAARAATATSSTRSASPSSTTTRSASGRPWTPASPSTPPPSSSSAASPRSYDGAVELAHLMADSDEAHKLLRRPLPRVRLRPPAAEGRPGIHRRLAAGSQGRHPHDQADHPRADQERRLPARAPVEE